MNNTTTKVAGTITEQHTSEVLKIFGERVAKKLEKCEGKTFLDILMETGGFDLTNKKTSV
jgi:hypothetical protein